MNFRAKKETKRLLKELSFYNASIRNPYNKRLNNIDMLQTFIL